MHQPDAPHDPDFLFAARTDWQLAPNRLTRLIEERRRKGLPILDLTESNPTHAGFAPGNEILAAFQDGRSLTYDPDPRGPLKAREAICQYYAGSGVRVSPEQIFLTTSTSEAYSYLFRLLADPGDHILVPQPSYPLFDFLAGLNDVRAVSYPLCYDGRWRIDTDAVREKWNVRMRAILVVHPNNPTGSFVSTDETAALIRCCRERRTALIADEVFLDYAFVRETRSASTHAAISEVLSFTLSGLSKISALPQMKLSWIVASGPADILKTALERLEVIADTYLSVSVPLAYALPALLDRAKVIQPQIMDRLQSNLRWLDEALDRHPGLSRLELEGGWYAILKMPAAMDDEECVLELLAHEGVIVHPGHFYDFNTNGYLVLSLLTNAVDFSEGVTRILARIGKNR